MQLLIQQDRCLSAVCVLHTRPHLSPVAEALAALTQAFASQPTWPRLHPVPVPADDVLTAAEIDAFSGTLFTELKRWAAEGAAIHLLLAGGRKPMAMVGMSVAQMLLGPHDRVWYLYSDDQLRLSGRMLLEPGDRAELILIPLPPTGAAPPRHTRSFSAETPEAARRVLADEQRQRVRHFLDHDLTPAERETALLAASELLTVAEIARRLHKSPKTVTNQLNQVYSKLESAFGLQPDVGLKREALRWILDDFAGVAGYERLETERQRWESTPVTSGSSAA